MVVFLLGDFLIDFCCQEIVCFLLPVARPNNSVKIAYYGYKLLLVNVTNLSLFLSKQFQDVYDLQGKYDQVKQFALVLFFVLIGW